jgi:hypothetical protein
MSSTEEPIRIYIGTDDTQTLGARVFEYSVRRHTTAPVFFDTMQSVTWPYPQDPRNYPGTHFSFHRFAIPKLAGYRGKALYVDADMLVLRDIRELWDTPFDGAPVLCAPSSDPGKRRRQLSVLLLDCGALDWDVEKIITEGLDAGRYTYDQLLYDCACEPAERVRELIPPEWNSLEKYEPGRTCLLHYTELTRQPWLNGRNRNGWLWMQYLKDAIRDGFISRDEVKEAQAKGWARPSLLAHLDAPPFLWKIYGKTVARRMDEGFEPHEDLRTRQMLAKKQAALDADAATAKAAT